MLENEKNLDILNNSEEKSMNNVSRNYGWSYYFKLSMDKQFEKSIIEQLSKYNYKVSFLFTTWNRKKYFEESIISILNMKYSNLEFVIVDDGSTDDTDEFINTLKDKVDFEVKYIKTKGGNGPGINKRIGFDYLTGDYVVFIDDDDFYISPLFLLKSFEIFENDSNISTVLFNSFKFIMNEDKLIFEEALNREGKVSSYEVIENFMYDIRKPNSTFPAVFDLKKYKKMNAQEMKILNDTSIYLRGFLGGDVYFCKEFVGVYRVHSGSMSKSLSIDYIIDNMNEKITMSKYLTPEINRQRWIRKQVAVTYFHYLNESKKISWKILILWTLQLTAINKVYFLFRIPKQRLKKYLKRN